MIKKNIIILYISIQCKVKLSFGKTKKQIFKKCIFLFLSDNPPVSLRHCMVTCPTRSLHWIRSLVGAWLWTELLPVYSTILSDNLFLWRRFTFLLLRWSWRGHLILLCGHTISVSSSLWWSTHLYSHLYDDSFICISLHSWHGMCRQYKAEVWSISFLQLGSAFRVMLLEFTTHKQTGQLTRRGYEIISA